MDNETCILLVAGLPVVLGRTKDGGHLIFHSADGYHRRSIIELPPGHNVIIILDTSNITLETFTDFMNRKMYMRKIKTHGIVKQTFVDLQLIFCNLVIDDNICLIINYFLFRDD